MRLNGLVSFGLGLLLFLFYWNIAWADSLDRQVQDNPVEAMEVSTPPVIDGIGNDACWEDAKWQVIDQVWIVYGVPVEADDFSGRYKVAWSATENLLYFLVEVSDDVFIDGYRYGETADIYNYDIVEVFIDEDKSGGYHTYDENAFAYHIYADYPADGQVSTEFRVNDIGSNFQTANYTSHFPEFTLRKNGNQAVWEFSLIVYNDTYEENNKDQARAQLATGKVIGLSLAYCDNDTDDGQRDNFYGSVEVEAEAYNDHWMNADDFGTLKLVSPPSVIKSGGASRSSQDFKVFPNPTKKSFQIKLDDGIFGQFDIKLYNLLGQEVYHTSGTGGDNQRTDFVFTPDLSVGMYFIEINCNDQRSLQKVFLIR
jgi:hypothetical protein